MARRGVCVCDRLGLRHGVGGQGGVSWLVLAWSRCEIVRCEGRRRVSKSHMDMLHMGKLYQLPKDWAVGCIASVAER